MTIRILHSQQYCHFHKGGQMKSTIVIGLQWGDEGKGKIVDYLSKTHKTIIRCAGGNNAGHTIKIRNKKYVLSLLPSGILQKNTVCILGTGMVIDYQVFHKEYLEISKKVKNTDIKISHLAHLLMPYHVEVESRKTADIIGTTKKGIGPAYEDKIARRGIRVCDLFEFESLKEKITSNIMYWNFLLQKENIETYVDSILEDLMVFRENYKHMIVDTNDHLSTIKPKKILLEGAQGFLLDIDYGTYPYVTSSNTTAAGCCQGSGTPITSVKNIVGIFKAYTTRVGNGNFITEINDDVSSVIREEGGEYGSITGRPRRIGWLDLPALKYAVKINGVTELAITKLDILSNLKEILVCKEYNEFANKKPIYEKVESWYEYDFKCKKYNELPDSVKNYIKLIEDYVGCPVKYIGTGPNRNELIVRNKGVK